MNSLKRTWINLTLAPLWFLFLFVLASVYYGSQGISESEIPELISSNISIIILVVQVLILTTLYLSTKKENFNLLKDGWMLNSKKELKMDIANGLILGSVLALIYFVGLAPLQLILQNNIGDYVPAGETMNKLGAQVIPFFIANVLLAPFVEESLYRNYALTRLLQKYAMGTAIFINALFFGLLHWSGGIWYILLTGLFIGVPFAFIAYRQKRIILVFIAHLILNLIEFLYITGKA